MKSSEHWEIRTGRDERERLLRERIRLSHDAILERARSLSHAIHSSLDPLGPVRRNPLGGFASGIAAGILLGAIRKPFVHETAPEDQNAQQPSLLSGILSTLSASWSILPSVAPIVLSLIRRKHARR